MSESSFALEPIIQAPAKLPDDWAQRLDRCTVDEAVNRPATAVLVFKDPFHDLLKATGIKIGTTLKLVVTTVADKKTRIPLFSGEVTAVEAEYDGPETGTYTVLRATDRAHRLLRHSRVHAFKNKDAAGIVHQVARNAGMAVGTVQVSSDKYDQLSQANVTDWEFLRALAAEHGAWLWIDDRNRLCFAEPTPAASAPSPSAKAKSNPLVLEYGENLLSLRAVLSTSEQVDKVTVRGWDVKGKRALSRSEAAVTSTTVEPRLSAKEASARFGGGGPRELVITDGAYRTNAEVASVAKAQAATAAAGFGELEAVCRGNPHLRARTPVALGGRTDLTFPGRYTISASHHEIEPGRGYRTTVVVSGGEDRTLAGLVSDAPAGPPRMPGLAIGLVTDVQQEQGGGGRGWVKLMFPWLDDKYVTDWVRSVQWGGVDGGGVVTPDVDDEVLVGFEQGLLDRPYVLGGLYNGKDEPSPHQANLKDGVKGKVARRSFSSRKGNQIELLDHRNGPSGVTLRTGKDELSVELDRHNTKIVVHSDGSVHIEAAKDVKITGEGVDINAGRGKLALTGGSVSINASSGEVSVGAFTDVEMRGMAIRLN